MNTRLFSLLLAAFALTLLPSCMDPPPGSESSIWQRPPRYGHGGTESPGRQAAPGPRGAAPAPGERTGREGSSRFGYSGSDPAPPASIDPPSPSPPAAPRERDREAEAPEERPAETTRTPPPAAASGPPSVAEMPFAKGVPGKPLSVTLPAPHAGLGEISIEQHESGRPTGKPLPPGTPVEIPDPTSPGKKIYFKVP